ncbi:MAG: bifunctional oligoribonuclease/PAP phosphatase NrnA [Ignavibacteria bacterium]|nr:bifunctional oligoribonuclease/PAP phosphatase NrnA [Ignavibacteria bacterium]
MYSDLISLINNNQRFILTTHVNPDGDALGSEIAFLEYLERIGKSVRIINYSETPYNFRFLDPDNRIEKFSEELHGSIFQTTDVFIILDTNDLTRLRTIGPHISGSKSKKVVIDHHLNTDLNNFDFVLSDTDAPATAEIIYRLFKNTKIEITYKMAVALYTAIMTDTGSFRFDRTNPETHRISAELIQMGVKPFEVYSEVYNRATPGKLHLLGRFLNKIRLEYNEKLAYSYITQDDFLATNTDEYAVDGLSAHLMSLETVVLGIVFTETKTGIKVSFRSKGDIYCNELAKIFGGGGHKNASGTFVNNGNLNELISNIILNSEKFIKQ